MLLKGCHILCSKDTDGTKSQPFTVFYSPSNWKRDDAIEKGYILLPRDADNSSRTAEKEFGEKYGSKYHLAPISTYITDKFTKNWKLILELPDFKP